MWRPRTLKLMCISLRCVQSPKKDHKQHGSFFPWQVMPARAALLKGAMMDVCTSDSQHVRQAKHDTKDCPCPLYWVTITHWILNKTWSSDSFGVRWRLLRWAIGFWLKRRQCGAKKKTIEEVGIYRCIFGICEQIGFHRKSWQNVWKKCHHKLKQTKLYKIQSNTNQKHLEITANKQKLLLSSDLT